MVGREGVPKGKKGIRPQVQNRIPLEEKKLSRLWTNFFNYCILFGEQAVRITPEPLLRQIKKTIIQLFLSGASAPLRTFDYLIPTTPQLKSYSQSKEVQFK